MKGDLAAFQKAKVLPIKAHNPVHAADGLLTKPSFFNDGDIDLRPLFQGVADNAVLRRPQEGRFPGP